MAEMQKVRLGDIVKTNQNTYSPNESWTFVNYLDTGNITENKIEDIQHINTLTEKLPSRARRKVRENSIIYSTVRPNQQHYGIIKKQPDNFLVSTGFTVIDVDTEKAVADYIYYVLTQQDITEHLQAIAEQSVSAYPSLKPSDIENLEISLPDIDTQKRVVSILSAIDAKITKNAEINNNLEQQAQAIYKAWFVDFSAFGGTAPNDWQTYHLVDFLPVITGKKNANVSSNQGKYPFFSCSQDYAWTDDYSFDGSAILVAGNGDFNVKFYSGKFEAYQRTYVLIPYEPKYTAWLFYAVQYHLSSITSAARGSVIKFITKGNLEDFEFVAPKVPLSLPIIYNLDTINRKIAANREENLRLGTLRDTLLPKLMSGELDVSDIDL